MAARCSCYVRAMAATVGITTVAAGGGVILPAIRPAGIRLLGGGTED